jgi:hypothetical protein
VLGVYTCLTPSTVNGGLVFISLGFLVLQCYNNLIV